MTATKIPPVPPTDPAANVAGLRTLGTGSHQALPGNTALGGSSQGTLANRPAAAAGNAGSFYFATDSGEKTLYLSNGSTWTKVGGLIQALFGWVDVNQYGAVGDCKRIYTGSMTSGSATLTATGSLLAAADVGKTIVVTGAGAAGAPLKTTISAFTDANHVTLAANASSTVSTKTCFYGTDDSTAIQAALDAAGNGVTVFFHNQRYLVTTALTALTTDNTKTLNLIGSGQRLVTSPTASTYAFEYGGASSIVSAISGATPTLLTIGQDETLDKTGEAGPIIEGITFEDVMGASTRLVFIQQYCHGSIRRCHFFNGRIGLELDAGTGSDDASWWTIAECVYGTNTTGLRLTSGTHGTSASPTIEVSGGDFEVPAGGIGIDNHANTNYLRIHDIKMDIFGVGSTGILWNSGAASRVHVQMEFHADVDNTTIGVNVISSMNGFDLNVQMGNDSAGQLGIGVQVAGIDATVNKTIGMNITGRIHNMNKHVYLKQYCIGNTIGPLRMRGSSSTHIVIDSGANYNLMHAVCADSGSGVLLSDSGTGNVVSRWLNPGGISAA